MNKKKFMTRVKGYNEKVKEPLTKLYDCSDLVNGGWLHTAVYMTAGGHRVEYTGYSISGNIFRSVDHGQKCNMKFMCMGM